MRILVLNSGSSSVKYQLFDTDNDGVLCNGVVERIGQDGALHKHKCDGDAATDKADISDHEGALALIRGKLLDPALGGVRDPSDISAVGHRVVHGGEAFVQSCLIDDEVEKTIERYAKLAPLHNPPNLMGIRAARRFFPDVPHIAVFDTAFHQTIPPHASLYALPYELYEKHAIRRYGFHGTSHRYVAQQAALHLEIDPEDFTGITVHLGNGCSLAAIEDGHCVDTSMGLTPLEGVAMGTRSGDIDPAIVFHLVNEVGIPLGDVERLLNKESGLLGVSGVSNDLREVQQAAADGNQRAALALDIYAYRVRKYIGAYLAVLDDPMAVVFTGGIGENSPDMRHRILHDLEHLGVVLDEDLNSKCSLGQTDVAAVASPIRILMIPTNEELMIARDARALLGH